MCTYPYFLFSSPIYKDEMCSGKVQGSHCSVPGTEPVQQLYILNLEIENNSQIVHRIVHNGYFSR